MAGYVLDRARTGELLKKAGKVVVIGKPQVRNKADGSQVTTDYVVAAVQGIWQAGLPAELTFRISEGILKEAMQALVPERARLYAEGKQVLLGTGSICALSELESALNMGFDFVVSPADGIGGTHLSMGGSYEDPIRFVQLSRQANVYAAPAAFSPREVGFYLFRDDGLRPDALKIFNSEVLAADNAKALGGLLAPFARDDGRYANKGYIIMPTGAVNRKTGPTFEDVIRANGFFPVLGMSDPIEAMKDKASRDPAAYATAIQQFILDYSANLQAFAAAKAAKGK